MTPAALLAMFRSEVKDAVAPYLWSDADVFQYIWDAEQMFCRLTNGITDASTAAVVDIPVAAGATWLTLHASILKIRGATRTSDGAELTILNYEDLAGRGLRFDGKKAPVSTVIVGMEENKLRLHAVASAVDAIKLLVFRLPLAASYSAVSPSFEITATHHYHLLDWVKSLAYLKQDAETFDKSKSEECELRFRGYCEQAKREQDNKRHKVRSVVYGGL